MDSGRATDLDCHKANSRLLGGQKSYERLSTWVYRGPNIVWNGSKCDCIPFTRMVMKSYGVLPVEMWKTSVALKQIRRFEGATNCMNV